MTDVLNSHYDDIIQAIRQIGEAHDLIDDVEVRHRDDRLAEVCNRLANEIQTLERWLKHDHEPDPDTARDMKREGL